MNIPKALFKSYLAIVTSAPPGDKTDPMEEMSAYGPAISAMVRRVEEAGDLIWLRFVLRDILRGPEDQLLEFRGMGFPYDSGELKELFEYTYQFIWESDPSRETILAKLNYKSPMSVEEWHEERVYQFDSLFGWPRYDGCIFEDDNDQKENDFYRVGDCYLRLPEVFDLVPKFRRLEKSDSEMLSDFYQSIHLSGPSLNVIQADLLKDKSFWDKKVQEMRDQVSQGEAYHYLVFSSQDHSLIGVIEILKEEPYFYLNFDFDKKYWELFPDGLAEIFDMRFLIFDENNIVSIEFLKSNSEKLEILTRLGFVHEDSQQKGFVKCKLSAKAWEELNYFKES